MTVALDQAVGHGFGHARGLKLDGLILEDHQPVLGTASALLED
jgi:hypothetical protein